PGPLRGPGPVMAGSRRAVRELCRSFGHYNRHLARLQHNLRETKRFFRDVKYSQGHPLASALAGDDPPSAGDGDGGPGDGPALGDTAPRGAQGGILGCVRKAGSWLSDPCGSLPAQDIPWFYTGITLPEWSGDFRILEQPGPGSAVPILLFCFISESRGIFPWKNLSKPALFFFPQEVDIVVAPCRSFQPAEATLAELVPQVLPVVTFAISEPQLSPADQAELRQIKAKFSLPIFFLCSPDPELTAPKKPLPEEKSSLRSQLLELGYLSPSEPPCGCGGGARSSLAEQPDKLRLLSVFCRQLLQEHLVEAATRLNELHCRCLNIFIDQAFDMQRDLQITPKRLEYTRRKENELYESLMGIANRKQEEMKDVIVETLGNMKEELLEDAAGMEFRDIIIPENGEPVSSKDIKCCIKQIQELIISRLNQAVANKLISSVDYLRESFVGTLERCLKSLEESWEDGSVHITSNYLKQILNAAYHVEVTFHSGSTVTRMLWEQIKQVQTLGKVPSGAKNPQSCSLNSFQAQALGAGSSFLGISIPGRGNKVHQLPALSRNSQSLKLEEPEIAAKPEEISSALGKREKGIVLNPDLPQTKSHKPPKTTFSQNKQELPKSINFSFGDSEQEEPTKEVFKFFLFLYFTYEYIIYHSYIKIYILYNML
uniref:Dual serine/threonine and tyrosine protein kinase n=1 Tax=Malurus cyaneus samueli TaxID=2593467 RepID=A0A8C5TFU1_9PASS